MVNSGKKGGNLYITSDPLRWEIHRSGVKKRSEIHRSVVKKRQRSSNLGSEKGRNSLIYD